MAIVTFYAKVGTTNHNTKEEVDTVADLGMEDGEWENLSEDAKYQIVDEWGMEQLATWYTDDPVVFNVWKFLSYPSA